MHVECALYHAVRSQRTTRTWIMRGPSVTSDETRRARVKGKICLVPEPILQRPLASPTCVKIAARIHRRCRVPRACWGLWARRCRVQIIVFAVPPSRRSEPRKVHALRMLPRLWTHPESCCSWGAAPRQRT